MARALAVAVVILALSAAAHASAGGAIPGPGPATVLALVLAGAALLVTRWRLSRTGSLALLAAGQLVVHEALLLTSHGQDAGPPLDGGDDSGSAAPTGWAAAIAALARHAAEHDAASTTPAGVMLAAHVVATIATGLALARGEDLLWTVWGWLQPLRALLARPLVPAPPQARPVPPLMARRPTIAVLARTVSRRGPPVAIASPPA